MKSLVFLPALFLEVLLHSLHLSFLSRCTGNRQSAVNFSGQAVILCKIRMLDGGAGSSPDWTKIPLNTRTWVLFQVWGHRGHRLLNIFCAPLGVTLPCWRGVVVQCWLASLCPKIAVTTGIKFSSSNSTQQCCRWVWGWRGELRLDLGANICPGLQLRCCR